MLGYVLGCFAWGALKASALGAHRSPGTHALSGFGVPELTEELTYRAGLERAALRGVGNVPTEAARIAQAAAFGLIHPGLEVDAAVGGYVYSRAYDSHGLLGAVLSHVAHNAGVWFGSK